MAQDKTLKPISSDHDRSGVNLETLVTRIQRMMDPSSIVTHNERLEDRVGNTRQYDVVIRGRFGGRSVLGIVECKDHRRKKGPDAVEAFAKKTENLGANLRLIVSRRGFTKQALKLAKHENIGCLSLLPEDGQQVGFSIGDMWYGVIQRWANIRLTVHFSLAAAPITTFEVDSLKWGGKPVANWFIKELLTTYCDDANEGERVLNMVFDEPRNIEISGAAYPVASISCVADRVFIKKRKWVSWSGDALLDWHSSEFKSPSNPSLGTINLTVPPGGTVIGSSVETDLSVWPDYDGEIPDLETAKGLVVAILYNRQRWDENRNSEVPDLLDL